MEIEAREGAEIPNKFYGLAYRDFCRYKTVWYPLGIHLIVRWTRNIYHAWIEYFVIGKCKPSRIDKMITDAKGDVHRLWEKRLQDELKKKDMAWIKAIEEETKRINEPDKHRN